MKLIETATGELIPLDKVEGIRQRNDKTCATIIRRTVCGHDTCEDDASLRIERIRHELTKTIIPAQPGWFVVGADTDGAGSIYAAEYPIIGWEVSDQLDPQPISPGWVEREHWGIKSPDGQVNDCGCGELYGSIEHWEQYVIDRVEREAAKSAA